MKTPRAGGIRNGSGCFSDLSSLADPLSNKNPLTPASSRASRNNFGSAIPSFESSTVRLEGVLTLGLRDLFQAIEKDNEKTFIVRCSYFEIYNDYVYDLLGTQETLD